MRDSSFTSPRQWLAAAAFLLLLAGVAWSFAAGLGGALIFDDAPNLDLWKKIGDIDSRAAVLAFITSSNDFPGRPLSLLSFLVDDQSWQPAIATMKRTNLAIHLLNTCLAFWLCLRLFRHLLPALSAERRTWLALFAAAVFASHPLQVSNVSYVIQRMNLLSTLLELTGLLLWLHGRELLATNPRRALLLCSLGIGAFMPLAVLAKENGLLLCAFALLAEAFCFPRSDVRWWSAWKWLFLKAPLLAFVAYCLRTFHFFLMDYPARDFTSWERLLTQGPVLVDYLNKLLLPRLQGSGLYFDNFPVSRSLLSPPWTLACWLLLGGMLAAAWKLRRRLPLVAFGIFFYFIGHLMESTLLPLELYFEHRNYLPQLGLWMAVAGLAAEARSPRLQWVLRGAGVLLVGVLLLATRQNAMLWSHPDLQAAVWYQDNPGSLRTSLTYANFLVKQHRTDEAGVVLDRTRQLIPDVLIVALAQKYVHCYLQDRPDTFDDLAPLARRAQYENASMEMLELMWKAALATRNEQAPPGSCQPASTEQVAAIYTALLENPRFVNARVRATLASNLGAWASLHGDLNLAMHYYDQAFGYEANPLYAYQQATMLLSAGLPGPAAEYSARARQGLTLRMRMSYPAMANNLDKLDRTLKQLQAEPRP